MSRRPDLFIVGAPKCGTTSLYEYLKGHPDIYMSPAKEPRYFGNPGGQGHLHDLQYGEDEQRYLDLFALADVERRVGEASPGYIYVPEAPARIHEFQPDARIVVMVRNPVEMVYSLHNTLVATGLEQVTDFKAAISPEPAGRRERYLNRGSYARHLPRWFDTFGRDRVYVMVFEDLVADPDATFERLLRFLDVDASYRPEFVAHNAAYAPRMPGVRRLARTRPLQWLLWRGLPAVAGDHRFRNAMRRFRSSSIHRRDTQRDPLTPALRAELQREFAPDVARLSEMLGGRDLAQLWWSKPARRPTGDAG